MVTSLSKWSLPCLVAGMMMPVLPAVAEDGEGVVRLRTSVDAPEGVVRLSDAPQTVIRGQSPPPGRLPLEITQTAHSTMVAPPRANLQTAMQEDAAGTAKVTQPAPAVQPAQQTPTNGLAPTASCAPLSSCAPDFAAVSAAQSGQGGGIFGNGKIFGNGVLGNGGSGHGVGAAGRSGLANNDSFYSDGKFQNHSYSQSNDPYEYGGEDLPLALGLTTALRNDLAYHGAWVRGKTGIADGYGPDGQPLTAGRDGHGHGALALGRQGRGGGGGPSGRLRLGRDPLMGKYQIVYPVDPNYFDARDGQVYAAQGYGGPVSVPLAPVVNHTYNYGWGVPSSRLTPVQHPVRQAPPATVPGAYPSAPVSY